ncbi:hypothetical protein BST96_09330 [Oceanicoccus sagamiensis]|uniref:LPS-assembly protein LptD n=1 Tax=Oceanicoccus sagamiensis TaxID=716816 RepID=A0A1X9NHA0_9GAMM|nr:LPS assembly protein LptD [Oceanicoccus sagamiensis]ARN74307.1 hypothetical protein BST96_09330 [Oceanicoccus sagamiensis]
MAASKYSLPSIANRLFVTAFVASALVANTRADISPDQQWVCKADAKGQWQCQGGDKAGKAAPQPAATVVKTSAATTPITTRENIPHSDWDWVAIEQLEDPSLCKTGCEGAYIAPDADWEDADKDPDNAPLRASADNSSMEGNIVKLSGQVELTQGSRRLRMDNAILDRDNNQLKLDGNVEIREPDILVRANRATLNTEDNLGRFEQALFVQHNDGFRGQANVIDRASATTLDLEQGIITQCSPDDETWKIHASSIHLDSEEGWGSAKHARVNINDIPVFYSPYMTFPIDDRRKTGLLFPTLATSNSNGFELSAPLYLNLAPNYDATITPRFIEKRGTMLEAEVRQMSSFGTWVLSGAKLKDDQFKETADDDPIDPPLDELFGRDDDIPPREDRWVGRVEHKGKIGPILTKVDYNKVSDEDFFDDLSPDSLELKRSDHLTQSASLGYRDKSWQTELLVEQSQTIDDLLSSQYQLMPQLTIEKNYTGANFSPEWLFEAEFTDFKHDESIDDGGRFETGERVFAEVGASYPMRWAPVLLSPPSKCAMLAMNWKPLIATMTHPPPPHP